MGLLFGPVQVFFVFLWGLVLTALQVINVLFNLIWFLLSNLHWVILLVILALVGAYWAEYHNPVVEGIEVVWRCRYYSLWRDFFRPLLNMLRELYNGVICWTNALGQFNRLFTRKFLFELLRDCQNGADLFEFLGRIKDAIIVAVRAFFTWFTPNPLVDPLEKTFPVYPIFQAFCLIVEEMVDMFVCLCDDLRPIFQLLGRWIISDNLKCATHQLVNGLLGLVQLLITLAFTLIQSIPSLFAGNVREFLLTPLPAAGVQLEKINVGVFYLGGWGNDVIHRLVCTATAEINAGGNDALLDPEYQACLADPDTRVDIFGIFTTTSQILFRFFVPVPVVEDAAENSELASAYLPGPRSVGVLYSFLTSLPPAIIGIIEGDPNPPLIDIGVIDLIWDTFRDPPPILGQASSIKVPGATIYGNLTSPPYPTCNGTYPIDIIPCAECPALPQRTVEESLCITAKDFDELLDDVFDAPLFDALLCRCGGALLRAAVAVGKYAVDVPLHLLQGLQAFADNLADSRQGEAVFDEFIGRPEMLGGILLCCQDITRALLDSRLDCVCGIFVLPLKAAGEALRNVYLILVALLNSLLNKPGLPGEPVFEQRFCIGAPPCLQFDNVVNYLRQPRERDPFESNHDFVPVNQSRPDGLVECICSFLDFSFVNQFLDEPITGVPDLCCGIKYAMRAIIEVVQGLLETVVTFVQMLLGFFRAIDDLITFEYWACINEYRCSTFPNAISDLQEFLQCTCVFLDAIGTATGTQAGIDAFQCICDVLDGLALATTNLLRAVAILIAAIVNELACISQPGATSECDSLNRAIRWADVFDTLNTTLDDFEVTARGLWCTFGLVLQFDCIDASGTIAQPGDSCGVDLICRPSDRLADIGGYVFNLASQIIRIILRISKAVIFIAFGQTNPDLPPTISQFIKEVLLDFAAPVWGVPGSPPTQGLIQAIGKAFNCLFGPSGCQSGSSGNVCLGDVFVIIGDSLRDIGTIVINILVQVVRLIESLFTGDGQAIGDAIVELLRLIFKELLLTLLNLAGDLITFVFDFFEAILRAIIPAPLVEFFVFILNIVRYLEPVLRGVLSLVICIFSGFSQCNLKKRAALSQPQSLSAEQWENFQNITAVANNMTEDTWCKRVVTDLSARAAGQEQPPLTVLEEGVWKYCYAAAIAGETFNSINDRGIQVPLDIFYNPERFATTLGETVSVLSAYVNYRSWWSTAYVDMPIDTSLDELDLDSPPDVVIGPTTGNDTIKRAVLVHEWGHAPVYRNMSFSEVLAVKGMSHCTTGITLVAAFEAYENKRTAIAYERFLSLADAYLRAPSTMPFNDTAPAQNVTAPQPAPTRKRGWWTYIDHPPYRPAVRTAQHDIGLVRMAPRYFDAIVRGLSEAYTRWLQPVSQRVDPHGVKQRQYRDTKRATFPGEDPEDTMPWDEELDEYEAAIAATVYGPHPPPPPLSPPPSTAPWASNHTRPENATKAKSYQVPPQMPTDEKPPVVVGWQHFTHVFRLYADAVARSYSVVQEVVQKRWDHVIGKAPERMQAKFDKWRNSLTLNQLTAARKLYRVYGRLTRLPVIGQYLAQPSGEFLDWAHRPRESVEEPEQAKKRGTAAVSHQQQSPLHAQFLDFNDDDCDCLILNTFVEESIEIFQFCFDEPPQYPVFNRSGGLIELVPVTNLTVYPSNFILRWLASSVDKLIGFSLGETIVAFVQQDNLDPFADYVGLFYLSRGFLPISQLGTCDRDVHLSGAFGMGIGRGILVAFLLTFGACMGLYWILPQVAGFWWTLLAFFGLFIVVIPGVSGVFFSLTVILSWGFNPLCLLAPSLSFPFIAVPMLPQHAADDIMDTLDWLIRECYEFYVVPAIVQTGSVCPACNETLNLVACGALGFNNPTAVAGFYLQTQLPGISSYFRQTCLVRNCFPFYGVLSSFLDETIIIGNRTLAEQATNEACGFRFLPVLNPYAVVGLIGILLLWFFLPIILRVLGLAWTFLTAPEIQSLVPGLADASQNVYGTGSYPEQLIGASSQTIQNRSSYSPMRAALYHTPPPGPYQEFSMPTAPVALSSSSSTIPLAPHHRPSRRIQRFLVEDPYETSTLMTQCWRLLRDTFSDFKSKQD